VTTGRDVEQVEDMEADDSPLMGLDPHKPQIITAWGKKGSGKSYLNRMIFRSWPYDRLCIDVNGNADPGIDAERVTLPLPTKFPAPAATVGEKRRPQSLYFRAHPGSPTYREDLDRAVGLALYPQDHRCLVWAGEVGALQPRGNAGPHMATLLQQNRHYNVTALFDGPRPVYVDPLTLAQSNLVAVYKLPNPADRKRIAESIGMDPREFDRECFRTWRRGDHWFLLYDDATETLYRHEPLPELEDEQERAA
jgi:hypothetical protein